MENLKIIENELVPVYESSTGEKVVYGTELHGVLEVKSNYRDWIKNRLNDCDAVENQDFDSFAKNLAKGGRPTIEYIIKLDTAKEMAMLERNEKGKQVRRYFIEVEKKYKGTAINLDGLSTEMKALIMQDKKLQIVVERVDKLENTMVIDYGQQRVLAKLVNSTVVTALGGKDKLAYKEIGQKVFAECNRDIKDRFLVNSRNDIPKLKFGEACKYIKNWQPCTNTKMMINDCNAQMCMV